MVFIKRTVKDSGVDGATVGQRILTWLRGRVSAISNPGVCDWLARIRLKPLYQARGKPGPGTGPGTPLDPGSYAATVVLYRSIMPADGLVGTLDGSGGALEAAESAMVNPVEPPPLATATPATGESTPFPASPTLQPYDVGTPADADNSNPDERLGYRWLAWLQAGVGSGRIKVNNPSAKVLRVAEGVLLVSPAIFRFCAGSLDVKDWRVTQKNFLKLGTHHNRDGKIFMAYAVDGGERIWGVLIEDPSLIFQGDVPDPNPLLTLIE